MPIKKIVKDLKARKTGPVQAAGGIVVRSGRAPLIAVVQMRKLGHWVLPKGKLNAGEDALTAARREVLEETGHQVSVHEYLGALSYEVRRGPKVVQFWHMKTTSKGPVRKLMRDIKAVRWLPLDEAITTLTHPREQAFLAQVGPELLQSPAPGERKKIVGPIVPAESRSENAERPFVEMTLPSSASSPTAEPDPSAAAPADSAPPTKGLLDRLLRWTRG